MIYSLLTFILTLSCLGNSATGHHLAKRLPEYVSNKLHQITYVSDHLQILECDNIPFPANAHYPNRPLGAVGPAFSAAFWGGSLLLFCADSRLTGDPRSDYGPQCMCPQRNIVVNLQQVVQGQVHCLGAAIDPHDNNNNVFLLPQFAALRNLCTTHCHCSKIRPSVPSGPPGDRRPDYSSDSSSGSSHLSLRLPSSSDNGHSGSDIDIMSRDLVNQAPREKSVKAEEAAVSECGGQRAK